MNSQALTPAPKLLAVILDRDRSAKLEDILRERQVHFHFMMNAMGTASSEILRAFGLSGTEKTVCICVEPADKVRALMTAAVERLEFVQPGRGVAFIMPMSGVCASITHVFEAEREQHKERWAQLMNTESEIQHEAHGQLVVAVVNKGYSDIVMEAARNVGARGGTILHARRSDVEEDVKFFGISLQSEKEVVAIVVRPEQKKELMQAVNKVAGTRTEAHGIVISIPVESCAWLNLNG
jgi:nitrogen regulatory protein PII